MIWKWSGFLYISNEINGFSYNKLVGLFSILYFKTCDENQTYSNDNFVLQML